MQLIIADGPTRTTGHAVLTAQSIRERTARGLIMFGGRTAGPRTWTIQLWTTLKARYPIGYAHDIR